MRKLLLFLSLCFCFTGVIAQTKIITGTVTDAATHDVLIGVTVVLKGTNTGTVTDEDGKYALAIPAEGGTLVFSYIGYESKNIDITDQLKMDITLATSSKTLDDVLVIGYGTQIKREVTGSITKVGGDEIENTPVTSVEQTLQGKAAGVFIEANNGKVGSAIKVRIRGSTSILASDEPLYVVDGVPINTTAINDQLYVYLNPLNDINFNDIESISILKDASASAIYGSRGANGVVLITTKRGKKGDAKIDFDYQVGWSKPTHLREFLDADQFIDYFTQAAINTGKYKWREGIGNFSSEQDAIDQTVAGLNSDLDQLTGGTELGSVNTDWQAQAFQHALSTNSDLSISGGSDAVRYFLSAGYSLQNGIMITNSGNRSSLVGNLDATVNPKLDAGVSLNLARDINHDIPDDDQFSTPLQMVALSPITPIYDSLGNYNNDPVTLYPNPLIDSYQSEHNTTTWRTIANVYSEYKFFSHLSLRGEAAADISNLNTDRYWGNETQTGKAVGGYALNYNSSAENYDMKLLTKYTQTFFKVHNLEAVAGVEYQRYNDVYAEVDGEGFPNDHLKTVNSAATIVFGSGAKSYYRFVSYLARGNYNYNEKYLFSITGRYDGSSRFGENSRFGFFPSASVGWVISNEPFLANNNFLSFLKVRASYGTTGNAEIGNFNYLGLYSVSPYAGTSGLYPSNLANPNLSWERTAQTDAGVDFGLFKDRLNGELDYYLKNTDDLLLDVPVPATTGFVTQIQNIGSIRNQGFEFTLNADILTHNFKWSTSVNFAANQNKVVSLANGQELIDNGGTGALNVLKVGEPIGVFYGVEYAGVDPDNGDALWYVNGSEGDRTTTSDFNAANFVVLGDPNPKFIAGWSHTLSYKSFSLDFNLQSVYGNKVNLNGDHWMNGGAATYDNVVVEALNYWKQPGDVTDVPEPRLGYDNGNQFRSDRYLSDGSYVRLKTVTLSYSLPRSVLTKAKINALQLYVSTYNLLTYTKYDGWDPEVSSDTFADNTYFGLDFYSAPQPKTIVFGLSLTL